MQSQNKFCVKRKQQQIKYTEKFKIDQQRLHLQGNEGDIYIWKGRAEGANPMFLPYESVLAEKNLVAAHNSTINEEALMTITNVRSIDQIPSLKKVEK